MELKNGQACMALEVTQESNFKLNMNQQEPKTGKHFKGNNCLTLKSHDKLQTKKLKLGICSLGINIGKPMIGDRLEHKDCPSKSIRNP